MATRIYLRSEGSVGVTPSTWNFANQISPVTFPGTLKLNTGSAMTSKVGATGTTNPTARAQGRVVIGPLKAGTISGTVKGQMRGSENNTGANATPAIAVKIIQPNGTDRAVLLAQTASDSATAGNEFVTTLTNATFKNAAEGASISLTSQNASLGDYLVIEWGFRSATATTRNITQSYGNDNASDLPENTSTTTANNPWFEFSATIDFSQDVTGPTIASTAVAAPTTAYAVTAPVVASGLASYVPTLAYAATIAAIAAASTLFTPSVAYEVNAPTRASAATLYAPADVTQSIAVGLPTIASSAILSAPEAAATVSLPTLAATTSAAPSTSYAISPPGIEAAAILYPPVDVAQSIEVSLPTITSGAALSSPTLAAAVSLPSMEATVVVAPTAAYGVSAPALAASTLVAPSASYEVVTPTVTSPGASAPQEVAEVVSLVPPAIASGAVVSAPALAQTLEGATIASGSSVAVPSTAYAITAPTRSAAAVLSAPGITSGDSIDGAAIASTVELFGPRVALADLAFTLAGDARNRAVPATSRASRITPEDMVADVVPSTRTSIAPQRRSS